MAYTFRYYVQGEFTGQTRDGLVPFLVQKSFETMLGDGNYDYATSAIISPDLNGDLIPDSILALLQSSVQEYCLRYGIREDSVMLVRATVYPEQEHSLAEVYFTPGSPTRTTSDATALIYGHLTDASSLPSPSNLRADVYSDHAVLRWEQEGHALGFRIQDEKGNVLATVSTGPMEWVQEGLMPGTDYTYRVVAYNESTESPFSEIHIETLGSPSLPDRVEPSRHVEANDYPSPVIDKEDGRLAAFQSGIGDGLDLHVKIDKRYTTRELVSYEMQIRGQEIKSVNVYDRVDFRYRVAAKDAADVILRTSIWYDGHVNGLEPLTEDGSGKEDLVIPIENVEGASSYQVEIQSEIPIETVIGPDTITFSSSGGQAVREIRISHYGPKVKGMGIHTAIGSESILIQDEIPSPLFDSSFYNSDNTKKDINEWDIILYSNNANVHIWLEEEPSNYWFEKKFIKIRIRAQIINLAQTPWTPLIHNGYYYLNQSEHFLFSESEVTNWSETSEYYTPLRFTYSIDTYGTKRVPGELQEFKDVVRMDYTGSYSNVTFDKLADDMTLLDFTKPGTYISSSKIFKNISRSYGPVEWEADTLYGSSLKVFLQAKMPDGAWSQWKESVNGTVPSIPLSREVRYKVEMIAGDRKNMTETQYTDNNVSEFSLGLAINKNDAVLLSNVKTFDGAVGIDNLEIENGVYTSATFDFNQNVDSLGELTYQFDMPAGAGASISVFTASSDADSNWGAAMWQPLFNPVTNIDGSITGTVQSAPKRFMRYQARFTRSRLETTTEREIAGGTLQEGTHLNTLYMNGVVKLRDTTASGTYITPVLDFLHNKGWLMSVFEGALPDKGGAIEYYTFSSDDRTEVTNVTTGDPGWVQVQGGAIQSQAKRYIAVKVQMSPGLDVQSATQSPSLLGIKVAADTFAYLTPKVNLVYMKANTFYMTKETPVLKSITLRGTYDDIVTQELYTTSIASEVASDRLLYRITEKTIGDIVREDLAARQIDTGFTVFNKYELKTRMPGVILTSRDKNDTNVVMDTGSIQNGYVWAQTTALAQEYVYEQVRVKVGENNTVLVSPVPQQGCPVIVQDASKSEMIHVAFTDEFGRPTLDFQEEIETDGGDLVVLAYANLDASTLKLELYHPEEGIWQEFEPEHLDGHFVILGLMPQKGTRIRASYRIKHSFCVDYNYGDGSDFVKFLFHGAVLDEAREVKVSFETNRESAYYSAKEVDLNPVKNAHHSGFLYLTDKIEPAYKLELYVPSENLYANGQDMMYMTAHVTDKFGNPVMDETITFSADDGFVETIQAQTDLNGIAVAKYTSIPREVATTIRAQSSYSRLEDTKPVYLRPETANPRMSIERDMTAPDSVRIRVRIVGADQEPASGIDVVFSAPGVPDATVRSNFYGEAFYDYAPASDGLQFLTASVSAMNLEEKMPIGVRGGIVSV